MTRKGKHSNAFEVVRSLSWGGGGYVRAHWWEAGPGPELGLLLEILIQHIWSGAWGPLVSVSFLSRFKI